MGGLLSRLTPNRSAIAPMVNIDITHLIVLDFEANCSKDGAKDHEVCEFPAVLMDADTGKEFDYFRVFIKCVRQPKISQFTTELTGITDDDIAGGVEWIEALNLFDMWCDKNNITPENSMVVTCGDWDLKTMYPRQCRITESEQYVPNRVRRLFSKWVNVKAVYANHRQLSKQLDMAAMLNDIGLQLDGRHHSGIDDCRNIGKICKHLIENHEKDVLRPFL